LDPQTLRLIVKLQCKDFEPGEFTDIKDRSCEETIRLIDEFPWEPQRDHLRVGLTTPSVTIEGPGGEFLKLALYYSGKFVLYFIDNHHREFSRVLTTYNDSATSIQAFYQNSSSPPPDFARQHTPLQNVIVHFRSGNFTYKLNPATLTGAIVLICLFLVYPVLMSIAVVGRGQFSLWPFLLPALAFLVFAIVQIALLISHYRSAKDQVLILSHGLQEFLYGSTADPDRFNKGDIQQVVTHGMRGRGGYPALTRVEIIFKNGRSIDISCLILSQETLVSKFSASPQSRDRILFPFIKPSPFPPSSSSPS
jgi:hypothetical protein